MDTENHGVCMFIHHVRIPPVLPRALHARLHRRSACIQDIDQFGIGADPFSGRKFGEGIFLFQRKKTGQL